MLLFEMSFIKLKENKRLIEILNILGIERDELFGDYSKFQEKLIDTQIMMSYQLQKESSLI